MSDKGEMGDGTGMTQVVKVRQFVGIHERIEMSGAKYPSLWEGTVLFNLKLLKCKNKSIKMCWAMETSVTTQKKMMEVNTSVPGCMVKQQNHVGTWNRATIM